MNDIEDLFEWTKGRIRPYAPDFTWLGDKRLAELGVVRELAKSLQQKGQIKFRTESIRSRTEDPPDCEADLIEGGLIGIEVTELVDSRCIADAVNGNLPEEDPIGATTGIEKFLATVRKKDSPKRLSGGPYTEYALVIYTADQRFLGYEFIEALRAVDGIETNLIDHIYFLMAYPTTKGVHDHIHITTRGAMHEPSQR